MNDIAVLNTQSPAVAEYFRSGNVAGLTPQEKDVVLAKLCERYGLDIILRPFDLISFKGVEKFYMTASATNQLAAQKQLSRVVTKTEIDENVGIARCYVEVRDPSGRLETGSAALSIFKYESDKSSPKGVRKVVMDGEELANAINKLETKAKRRVTLAFFGVPDVYQEDDRPSAMDLPRSQVIADAHATKEIADKIGQPAPTPTPTMPAAVEGVIEVDFAAPEVIEVPAATPAPKARRGRKAAAESAPEPTPTPTVPPVEKAAVIEAVQAAVAASVETPQATQAVPTPEPTPLAALAGVVYEREKHANLFMRAVTLALGSEAWKNDAVMREKAKSLIPILDRKLAICEAVDSVDPLPSFVDKVKSMLS